MQASDATAGSAPPSTTDVLVVGAGPTGLMLAHELRRRGIDVTVVETLREPAPYSRALVVHPRTIECFEFAGLADAMLAEAQPIVGVDLRVRGGGQEVLTFAPVDGPYPRPIALRQQRTEAILAARFAARGGAVHRGHRLVAFEQHPDHVLAHVETPKGARTSIRARYLAGCDGAHSTTRTLLGLGFDGSTYPQDFVQADCRVRWSQRGDHSLVVLGSDGVLISIPLGGEFFRIILIRSQRVRQGDTPPDLTEFQAGVDEYLPGEATLSDPEWMAQFRLHERIAPKFVVGRVVLVGDAAHIHTPAGGQGMNTGLQEAQNLAWKLDLCVRGRAHPDLLASFEAERRPIAVDILRFTDVLFRLGLGGSRWVNAVRNALAPSIASLSLVRDRVLRRATQLELAFTASPIVADERVGRRTGPLPGQRMPDARIRVDGEACRLFDLLRSGRHLTLVLAGSEEARGRVAVGRIEELLADVTDVRLVTRRLQPGSSLQGISIDDTWMDLERRLNPRPPEFLVIRPDGAIAYRGSGVDPTGLRRFFLDKIIGA